MTHTFKRCGHPMTEEHTQIRGNGYKYCRTCSNAKRRADYKSEGPEPRRRKARMRELPKKLAIARARVAKLEAEAISLGLTP